jgi:hypothetical protein
MSALVKSQDKAARPLRGRQQHLTFTEGPYAIDIPEVCDRLKATRGHIYPYIMSGELQTFKLGRRRLTTPQWLADFIARLESIESREKRGERSNIASNSAADTDTATGADTAPMRPTRRPSTRGVKGTAKR